MKIISKIFVIILSLSILLGTICNVNAAELNSETENIKIITREDYLTNYAVTNNITYAEAESIDYQNNISIWADYYERNNLPQPRSISYESSYIQGDATIYYVKIYHNYNDGVTSLTYGAYGKVIVDNTSRTFVKNSFSDNGFWQNNNNKTTITTPSLVINDSSYSQVHIYFSATCSITKSNASVLGKSHETMTNLGYDYIDGTNPIYRKNISLSNYQNVI